MNKILNILKSDAAENSIMQTITIAVSAILIAAGLVTAPGLINNARDNNAKTDLANIAYAQAFVQGVTGTYYPFITPEDEIAAWEEENSATWPVGQEATNNLIWASGNAGLNGLGTNVVKSDGGASIRLVLSADVESSQLVCQDDTTSEWAYLLRADSASSAAFFRASGSAQVAKNDAEELDIADCIRALDAFSEFITVDDQDDSSGTPEEPEEVIVFNQAANLGEIASSDPASVTIDTTPSDNVTLSIVGGNLPPGCSLGANGITGTPTATGTYTFTLRAERNSASVERQFTLDVVYNEPTGWYLNNPDYDGSINDVEISADGQVRAVVQNAGLWISTDSGLTWSESRSTMPNGKVSMTPDAGVIIAASSTGGTATIYRSTDQGATWTSIGSRSTGSSTRNLTALDVSPNGQNIIFGAGTSSGTVHFTTNAGENWNTATGVTNSRKVLATNSRLFAISGTAALYRYDGTGVGFTSVVGASGSDLAASDDGTRVIVYYLTNTVRVSTDGGATFSNQTGNASSLNFSDTTGEISSRGNYFVMTGYSSIGVSTDGVNWTIIPSSAWSSVTSYFGPKYVSITTSGDIMVAVGTANQAISTGQQVLYYNQ